MKPTIGVNAAVTVNDPIKFNGNSFLVTGINAIPPQWSPGECTSVDPGNSDDVVGVRSATGTGVTVQEANNVFGFPSRDAPIDPTVTSQTFTNPARIRKHQPPLTSTQLGVQIRFTTGQMPNCPSP